MQPAPQSAPAGAGSSRREWAARAMRAMRAGELDAAWLWADRLCRASAGSTLVDAYLLRSAVLALQRDHEAAQADLRAAAEIDPHEPAVNRVLLSAPIAEERRAAARRMLGAADENDRRKAFATLAREGYSCVGTLEASKQRLAARIAWNGPREITLTLRTDVGDRQVLARADNSAPPPGFSRSARVAYETPPGALAAALAAPDMRALFEPASVVFAPPKIMARKSAASALADELLIIIPVYDDREATQACFASLLAAPPERPCRIIAIDDASPDAAISADLDALAAEGWIELLRNAVNMGFAASVNRALALRAPEQDALLLNADVVLPPGAIDGLIRHFAAHADIGTATPLSNNGEDTSFPRRFRANPLPPATEIAGLNTIAARVNGGRAVDMPNGVGFCLFIKGEALDRVGLLPHAYGRGYYEDVEFCLAIAGAGYRNVCATDVYVGHHGGRSFGKDKRALVTRNLRRLSARHPTYLARARSFERADPLSEPVARIEWERLRRARAVDLLILPAETPQALARAIADGLRRDYPELVTLHVERSASDMRITFSGDSFPQNIAWRCDVTNALADELTENFSELTLRSAFAFEAERASSELTRVLARLRCDVRIFSALTFEANSQADSGTRAEIATQPAQPSNFAMRRGDRGARRAHQAPASLSLILPALPEYRPPRLTPLGGALAIIGMQSERDDDALLRTLAASRNAGAVPTIILAGVWSRDSSPLPDAIHVGGAIPDPELPRWLERAGASALLFANRRWGVLDPRFSLWRDAGLRVAAFDAHGDETAYPHGLSLPGNGAPAQIASALARWLSPDQA
ncbi:glycosyltransferase family 2 protein [Terrarubrum flagellatum]|uniref:glycosyltransferase family 2 protein n=1 Tax=Terrirubrum flagellatum TaxID=2895980 RepID=UPI00314509F0